MGRSQLEDGTEKRRLSVIELDQVVLERPEERLQRRERDALLGLDCGCAQQSSWPALGDRVEERRFRFQARP